MSIFDLPKDEVFVYVDGEKKTVAFIDGQPHLSEVHEWVSDFNADKITVKPAKGMAYTVYEDGNIQNCILDLR
jgi:hypothetical protein